LQMSGFGCEERPHPSEISTNVHKDGRRSTSHGVPPRKGA
jgi:hypothetical protein